MRTEPQAPVAMAYRWIPNLLALGLAAACLVSCQKAEPPQAVLATQPGKVCNEFSSEAQVYVAPGSFTMGDDRFPEEGPLRKEQLRKGFWMDVHEVTNGQFARFVEATGYITVAEVGAKRGFRGVVAVGTAANVASKMLKVAQAGDLLVGENVLPGLPADWAPSMRFHSHSDQFSYRASGNAYAYYLITGRY